MSKKIKNENTNEGSVETVDMTDAEKIAAYHQARSAEDAEIDPNPSGPEPGTILDQEAYQAALDSGEITLIDPKDLRADQREEVALAYESMALHEEQRWKEAQDARLETNRLLGKIAGENNAKETSPNIQFVGKRWQNGERVPMAAPTSLSDGSATIEMPDPEIQVKPFYHPDAARIRTLFPNLYKEPITIGEAR